MVFIFVSRYNEAIVSDGVNFMILIDQLKMQTLIGISGKKI